MSNRELWLRCGLVQFQRVRCVVTARRGRFGIDVKIVEPDTDLAAFIDFVMLSDGRHLAADEFPDVGSRLDAIAIDFMPNGELRLSARPSDLE